MAMLAPYTDEADVEALIKGGTTLDLEPYILAAHMIVIDRLVGQDCYRIDTNADGVDDADDEERLELVERYLAAWFVADLDLKALDVSVGPFKKRLQTVTRPAGGYNSNAYGQMALQLDCSKQLAYQESGIARPKVSLKGEWLGQLEPADAGEWLDPEGQS